MRSTIVLLVLAACGSSAGTPDAGPPDAGPPDASPLPTGPWTSPHKVVSGTTSWCEHMSLTPDLLTMYASCGPFHPTGFDITVLTRPTTHDPWSAPAPIAELSTTMYDDSPSISADQLTIWLTRPPDLATTVDDGYVATRARTTDAWGAPVLVPQFAGAYKIDVLPSELTAVEERETITHFDLWLHTRSDPQASWSAGEAIDAVNSNDDELDPALSTDLLQLYFVRRIVGCSGPCDQVYVATRARADQPFGAPVAVDELNALGQIRFPWLSPDGHTLYFGVAQPGSSVQAPIYDVYEATR